MVLCIARSTFHLRVCPVSQGRHGSCLSGCAVTPQFGHGGSLFGTPQSSHIILYHMHVFASLRGASCSDANSFVDKNWFETA